MSMETIIPPRGTSEANGDGDDYVEGGISKAEHYANDDVGAPGIHGIELPTPREGGRAAPFQHYAPRMLGGMSLGAFTPEAATNRGMPVGFIPPFLGRIVLPRREF